MDQTVDSHGDHIEPGQLSGLIDAAGVDGARDILDAFWRSTTEMLEQLSSELAENDLEAAARTCHAIKGMAANVGAARLSATVAKLETACKANDGATAAAKMSAAQSDFEAAQNRLLDHLHNAS